MTGITLIRRSSKSIISPTPEKSLAICPRTAKSTILIAKNISKSFVGVQALESVNVQLNAGEIHCLAGENGCGKSTLVKCISGVYKPDQGEIIINGNSFTELSTVEAMKQGIQVIYQVTFSLYDGS